MSKETRDAEKRLRAAYGELHPTRDPSRMKINDDTLALMVLMERRFRELREELDRRAVIKRCPPGIAEGAERTNRFREPSEFEYV